MLETLKRGRERCKMVSIPPGLFLLFLSFLRSAVFVLSLLIYVHVLQSESNQYDWLRVGAIAPRATQRFRGCLAPFRCQCHSASFGFQGPKFNSVPAFVLIRCGFITPTSRVWTLY